MTEEQIKEKVKIILNKIDNDQEIENPKVEFKRKWYNLTEQKKQYYEFLKDTSSISNTFEFDGFIIIGYDEKERKYYDARFKDCGLSDTSNIYDLINKHIAEPFDANIFDIEINGNLLSVIHLLGSINKPHVIKNFKKFDKIGNSRDVQNRVFVRKNTGTYPANRYDLDLMYYDKKNNIPEYDVRVDATEIDFLWRNRRADKVQFHIFFAIENLGRRPIAINDISLKLITVDDEIEITFELLGEQNMLRGTPYLENKVFVIKSNEICFFKKLVFKSNNSLSSELKPKMINDSDYFMELTLANKKVIKAKINVN